MGEKKAHEGGVNLLSLFIVFLVKGGGGGKGT